MQIILSTRIIKRSMRLEEDDLFELPPDPNPVSGFAEGPLPKFIELNLQVKYDLSLLKWFGGSKQCDNFHFQFFIGPLTGSSEAP